MINRAKPHRDQRPGIASASADSPDQPLELTQDLELGFDQSEWAEARAEQRGAGGRRVLGAALTIIAVAWLGWSAWSAGRTLVGQPLASPLTAQWIAIAAGPLALLGLVWLIFGRTRRREAEAFTRSVAAMHAEARSLEALLEVLNQRLGESQSNLKTMSEDLMLLGDTATGRLDGITRLLDESGKSLVDHGDRLDRAAESARNDLAVLLDDLPRAEETARLLADRLKAIGSDSSTKTSELRVEIDAIANQARAADHQIADSSGRLVSQLDALTAAGSQASERIGAVEASLQGALDTLLERTAETLEGIRAGIDAQSAAVNALVDQAEAGIARTGAESAEAIAVNAERADSAMERLSQRLADQEVASRTLIADIDGGLEAIDARVTLLSSEGDARARTFLSAIHETRGALEAMLTQAGSQEDSVSRLSSNASDLRDHIDRLAEVTRALGPDVENLCDGAAQAHAAIGAAGAELATQQDKVATLLATIAEGSGSAQAQLADLNNTIRATRLDAEALAGETGQSLVASLVRVREAAAQAAERARDAINAVIPEAASKLSVQARHALAQSVEQAVHGQMREVETLATRAMDAARGASERLTSQMLNLGQSASALEAHLKESEEDRRESDSEAFARRVSLLMDSMNSAAIDVSKILSDEIDDRSWDAYLKGNRGVFTRRAVRLLDGSEVKAIRAHYETDLEFQHSANRYIHDFEAMLRRVLNEREGGMIAVTLMSSDMGKLYAALAQVIERRR